MENILFNPGAKVVMECEYFQTKNTIFDEEFTIKSTKQHKKDGKFIKDELVLEYRDLDTYEILTYIYLCRCANNKDNAFPSYANIAKKVKCGRTKAIEAIKVLHENGFIFKEHKYNAKGENESNIYYINTDLLELKEKLDSLYPKKEKLVVKVGSTPGELGSTPGELLGSTPGELGSTPGEPKKEQYKKNNFKKEQYNNNNKATTKVKTKNKTASKSKQNKIVVDDREKDLAKMCLNSYYEDNYLKDKEIETIAFTIKEKHGAVKPEIIKGICNVAKNSKSTINNLGGFLVNAIKNDYKDNSHVCKSNNLKFNNFESRQYDYDKLEKQLLGWECDEVATDTE